MKQGEAQKPLEDERRKHKRYRVKDQTFVAFRPDFTRLGKIKDMSKGGIGCEYIAYQNMGEDFPVSEVDIFHSGNDNHLPRVPCRMVYDIPMSRHEETSEYNVMSRRCGLEFVGLTEEQDHEIERFLEAYIASEA